MKNPTKKILSTLFVGVLSAGVVLAQPTNPPSLVAVTVMVDPSTAVLLAPTNFFIANSNALNGAIDGRIVAWSAFTPSSKLDATNGHAVDLLSSNSTFTGTFGGPAATNFWQSMLSAGANITIVTNANGTITVSASGASGGTNFGSINVTNDISLGVGDLLHLNGADAFIQFRGTNEGGGPPASPFYLYNNFSTFGWSWNVVNDHMVDNTLPGYRWYSDTTGELSLDIAPLDSGSGVADWATNRSTVWQVDSSGHTMVADPTSGGHAVNLNYADTHYLSLSFTNSTIKPIQIVTSDYQITTNDYYVIADQSGNPTSIILHCPTNVPDGFEFRVSYINDSGANAILTNDVGFIDSTGRTSATIYDAGSNGGGLGIYQMLGNNAY